jgi:hypothetical protein
MRAPIKGDDYFCMHVNAAAGKVQDAFLEAIKPAIVTRQANAMLGDGTITKADTFDTENMRNFLQQLGNTLEGWTFSGVLESSTEDMHRLYARFTKEADRFYINVYFGIQYHVLLYYGVDRQVIEIQRELANIDGTASSFLSKMTGIGDRALATELEKRGFSNLEFEELFVKIFDDEKLVEELNEKTAVIESQFPEFEELRNRKSELLSKLNNMLVRFYQTSPVIIDYNRLMQGEEGITNYFDIEVIKNKKNTKRREAFIDTAKMPKEAADMLSSEIDRVAAKIRKLAR